jgi:hypothetical protein
MYHDTNQIGLRCFVGEEVARSHRCARLIESLEVLDPETAFQDLASITRTVITRKRRERAAIREIEHILHQIWIERRKSLSFQCFGVNLRMINHSLISLPHLVNVPVMYRLSFSLHRLILVSKSLHSAADHERDNLSALHEMYKDLSDTQRYRRVAYDVFHFLVASQANLYAALSWVFINMLTQPELHVAPVLDEIRGLHAKYGNSLGATAVVISCWFLSA